MSYVLPLWLRLFDASINQRENVAAIGTVSMVTRTVVDRSVAVLVWQTDPQDPVDVSYDLHQRVGSGGGAVGLTLSSSEPMDVRLCAAWEAVGSADDHLAFESDWVLHLDREPRRYVVPYSTFTRRLIPLCSDPTADPDWEKLVCLTFWPEAVAGEIEFHALEVIATAGADSDLPVENPGASLLADASVDVEIQPIDGFSAGTVPINWWYTPRWDSGELSFVNCAPSRSGDGLGRVLYRYPEASSSRTLVLQLHDVHRPVDLGTFEGLEITARADAPTECLIDVAFLDPAVPAPPGDPEGTPGAITAHLRQPLLFDQQGKTYRIPFSMLEVDSWVCDEYPDAYPGFHAATMVEVEFLLQDDSGELEVLGVNTYRPASDES